MVSQADFCTALSSVASTNPRGITGSRNVDAVVQIARQNNLVISMTMFHQRYRKFITLQNARAWAKWVAQRYKDVPSIVWSMTPEAKPEFAHIVRELAAGLHEGDGGAHLITFKPDPPPHPAGFLHEELWLDFSVMQVWKWIERIYPVVTQESVHGAKGMVVPRSRPDGVCERRQHQWAGLKPGSPPQGRPVGNAVSGQQGFVLRQHEQAGYRRCQSLLA